MDVFIWRGSAGRKSSSPWALRNPFSDLVRNVGDVRLKTRSPVWPHVLGALFCGSPWVGGVMFDRLQKFEGAGLMKQPVGRCLLDDPFERAVPKRHVEKTCLKVGHALTQIGNLIHFRSPVLSDNCTVAHDASVPRSVVRPAGVSPLRLRQAAPLSHAGAS